MTTAILHDHKLEKQMGCMTVFFQMFEKNQIITNRRINSTAKGLPSPSVVVSTSDSVKTVTSPAAVTEEMEKDLLTKAASPRSDRFKSSTVKEVRSMSESVIPTSVPVPVPVPAKVPVQFPGFEFKPRLSLDSRATMDSKGSLQPRDIRTKLAILSRNPSDSTENGSVADTDDNHRRSPSVIARLMGLELLPSCPEATKKSELRRSASESRATRDLLQCQFVDVNNNLAKQRNNYQSPLSLKQLSTASPDNILNANSQTLMKNSARGIYGGSQWKSHLQRRSFYDSDDSFPEPKQTSHVYAEIEKRLKMKGIDDPSKDLDTLKQLLEALQLKGLLHSNTAVTQTSDVTRHRNNFVYDRSFQPDKSQTSLMQSRFIRRHGDEFPPPLTFRGSSSSDPSPHRQQAEIDIQPRIRSGSSSSYTRKESNAKAPNPIGGKRQSSIATAKKSNNEQRRVSPSQSPVQSPRSKSAIDLSPKNRRQMTAEVKPVVTSSPQADSERRKPTTEERGKNLLERCDKLLNSIAEMTAAATAAAADSQPSPVSVLQYKEESASPSPVLKRCIDFKDQEQDDEYYSNSSSPVISPIGYTSNYNSNSSDPELEYVYIADIFTAITNLPEGTDVFLMLEQQYLKEKEGSTISKLERMAIFDMVIEILKRNRPELPPWKAAATTATAASSWPSLEQIWLEFQNTRRKPQDDDYKVRVRVKEEEPSEMILGVLRKDFGRDETIGWVEEPTVEISETVLDIERLIFKDLICETIQELSFSSLSKKLVF